MASEQKKHIKAKLSITAETRLNKPSSSSSSCVNTDGPTSHPMAEFGDETFGTPVVLFAGAAVVTVIVTTALPCVEEEGSF